MWSYLVLLVCLSTQVTCEDVVDSVSAANVTNSVKNGTRTERNGMLGLYFNPNDPLSRLAAAWWTKLVDSKFSSLRPQLSLTVIPSSTPKSTATTTTAPTPAASSQKPYDWTMWGPPPYRPNNPNQPFAPNGPYPPFGHPNNLQPPFGSSSPQQPLGPNRPPMYGQVQYPPSMIFMQPVVYPVHNPNQQQQQLQGNPSIPMPQPDTANNQAHSTSFNQSWSEHHLEQTPPHPMTPINNMGGIIQSPGHHMVFYPGPTLTGPQNPGNIVYQPGMGQSNTFNTMPQHQVQPPNSNVPAGGGGGGGGGQQQQQQLLPQNPLNPSGFPNQHVPSGPPNFSNIQGSSNAGIGANQPSFGGGQFPNQAGTINNPHGNVNNPGQQGQFNNPALNPNVPHPNPMASAPGFQGQFGFQNPPQVGQHPGGGGPNSNLKTAPESVLNVSSDVALSSVVSEILDLQKVVAASNLNATEYEPEESPPQNPLDGDENKIENMNRTLVSFSEETSKNLHIIPFHSVIPLFMFPVDAGNDNSTMLKTS